MRHPRTSKHSPQLPVTRSRHNPNSIQTLMHRPHTRLKRPRNRLSTPSRSRPQLLRSSRPHHPPSSQISSHILLNRFIILIHTHPVNHNPTNNHSNSSNLSTSSSNPTISTRFIPFRLFRAHKRPPIRTRRP